MLSDEGSRGRGSRFVRAARRACAGVGALLLVMLAAMGSGSAAAAGLNVTGTWDSVFTYVCTGLPACGKTVPGTFTLKQAQASSVVTGTYKGVLSVSGTLVGKTLTLDAGAGTPRLTVTLAPDDKSWSGSGTYPSSSDPAGVGTDTARRVSAGSSTNCAVPNVAGDTLAAAKSAIVADDCRVGKIKRVTSDTVKNGDVISQAPAAGSVGPKVSLDVSKGPGAPSTGGGSAGVSREFAGPTSQAGDPLPAGADTDVHDVDISIPPPGSGVGWGIGFVLSCSVSGGPPIPYPYYENNPGEVGSVPLVGNQFHDSTVYPLGLTIDLTIDGTIGSNSAHGALQATATESSGVVVCQPLSITWQAHLCKTPQQPSGTECTAYGVSEAVRRSARAVPKAPVFPTATTKPARQSRAVGDALSPPIRN